MSAATAIPAAPARATSRYRVTFAHLVKSEWIKIRTVRATWWTAAVTVVLMALIAFAFAMAVRQMPDELPAWQTLVSSVQFAQLPVAVLGALAITGEYSTGMIRSTLAAAPTRIPVLLTKTIVTAIVTCAISIIGLGLSFVIASPLTGGIEFTDDAIRGVATFPVYLVVVSVLATAVGFLVRGSAAAISILTVMLFVIDITLGILGNFQTWALNILAYTPSSLGQNLLGFGQENAPSTTVTWIALAAWAVVPLIAAAVVLKKRDA